MAEEHQNSEFKVPPPTDELQNAKKNGADIDDDDHDLFKSAMEVSNTWSLVVSCTFL